MKISVVIRTRNEEAWIRRCLTAVRMQDCDDVEIILVDNASEDGTVAIAQELGCVIVSLPKENFNYSRALNLGIDASSGELIAILSGHCIPVHDKWLSRLARPLLDVRVAGVYGRQEPLPDTGDMDKRDLWTTFGMERRIQAKDFFFHNANSMIRRSVWKEIPFNENLNGVEDREWAKHAIERGFTIAYEPTASVYHHHGIHQGRDEARAARVVRVIELINHGST